MKKENVNICCWCLCAAQESNSKWRFSSTFSQPSLSHWVSGWDWLRSAPKVFFILFAQIRSKCQSPDWDSRLRDCSSYTQMGDIDEEMWTVWACASSTWHCQHRSGWCVQQQKDLQRLSQPYASNLRPEHFLEVIILFDVRCLLFPPVSILSKRHPTTVMGFATLSYGTRKKHWILSE